jgi:dipeptidyl aminopeptidase/acylaminoacyl peptidase
VSPSRPFDTSVGVFLLDPAGGDPRLLASWPQVDNTGPTGASWSPDGRTLAVPYTIENPGGPIIRDNYAQLLLIDVRSGGVRELLRDREPATRYSVPSWSPDGRKLAYTRSQGVNRVKVDIWIGDPATGQTRNLTRTPKPAGDFSWSPDSRRIALSCGPYTCGKPKGIWTLSLNRKWKRLTRGFDFFPTWAPR